MQRRTKPVMTTTTACGSALLLVVLSLNAGCARSVHETGGGEGESESITFETFVGNVAALAESDGVSVPDNLSELASVVWAQEGPGLDWLQWDDDEYAAAQEWLDGSGKSGGPGPALMMFLASISDLAPDVCNWDQDRCVVQTTGSGQCAYTTFTNPHIHYTCGRWETRVVDTGACLTTNVGNPTDPIPIYKCAGFTSAPLGKVCY